MDYDPDIEVIYSGESDFPSDSKSSAKPDRTVADTKTAAPRGSLNPELRCELLGSSDEFENSSPGSNRSRSYSDEASAQQKDVSPYVDVDDSVRSHRSHSRNMVPVTLAPRKRSRIVMLSDPLLIASHGFHH